MKLKNKKTGEIADVEIQSNCMLVTHQDGRIEQYYFDSIKDLLEWEDYEEPKEYWYISDFGYVFNHEINNKSVKSTIEEMKSIGNYFDSREEAEKAVEKLKAWKRVKRDLVSLNWQRERDGSFSVWGEFKTGNTLRADVYLDIHSKDLDLLFGGEE